MVPASQETGVHASFKSVLAIRQVGKFIAWQRLPRAGHNIESPHFMCFVAKELRSHMPAL